MSVAVKRKFQTYALNRRWSNASLLKHRTFDGHIVSMQQSGSHWIKNMLAHVLAELYHLPPMAHIQDDSIIGHTKSPPVYKQIPQIVHSHGFPHALTLKIPFLHYPKYLVLVRELRESLVSHYERFKGDYHDIDFSTYLRGDVNQKKFHSDIYTRIRFMNEWGKLLETSASHVMVVRYEDIKKSPAEVLKSVCGYFSIRNVTDDVVARAVEASTPERMAEKPNPNVPTKVVRTGEKKPVGEYFTPENQAFFEETCKGLLRHDFGYGYKTCQS